MKTLLKKLFCPDSPARTALFAWTLGTVGVYLLFSFVFFCDRLGFPTWGGPGGNDWYLAAPGIGLLALIFFLNCLRLWGATLWKARRFRPLLGLIPALLVSGAGLFCCVAALPVLHTNICLHGGRCDAGPLISPPLHLAPEQWIFLFLAGCVLLLAGYFLLAWALGAGEGKKLRQLFGKGTLLLWGIALVFHFGFLGFALRESCRVSELEVALAHHFGRPVTAAALAELYASSGKTDGAFWKEAVRIGNSLPSKLTIGGKTLWWNYDLPDRPGKEFKAAYEEFSRRNATAIANFEKCFDAPPPLPERTFPAGDLGSVELPELWPVRHFLLLESGRVRMALERRDVDTAWKCYRRLINAGAPLRKDPCLFSALLWTFAGNTQLDCIEKMLESKLLSDARLAQLRTDLTELARTVPELHRRALYHEAVVSCDLLLGLETGRFEGRSIAFAPYRWVFPMVWYLAAKDKGRIFAAFRQPDFVAVSAALPKLRLLNFMRIHELSRAGWGFHDLTARTLEMQVLLRAEAHRRAHGSFPAEMSGLPVDPYTKKPLIYRVGEAEIPESFGAEVRENYYSIATSTVSVRAVAVRSPREPEYLPWPDRDRTLAKLRLPVK